MLEQASINSAIRRGTLYGTSGSTNCMYVLSVPFTAPSFTWRTKCCELAQLQDAAGQGSYHVSEDRVWLGDTRSRDQISVRPNEELPYGEDKQAS